MAEVTGRPDEALAAGLLGSAKTLSGGSRKPRQADLRRAVSAAYYAVFHALAKTCADALVGGTKARRPNKAWVEVYRGLNHGTVKSACIAAKNVPFPQGIQHFSVALKQLQVAREAADYDPMIRFTKVGVHSLIELAEIGIAGLDGVEKNDKIAFAAWVLITSKGAQDARKRVRAGNLQQI